MARLKSLTWTPAGKGVQPVFRLSNLTPRKAGMVQRAMAINW